MSGYADGVPPHPDQFTVQPTCPACGPVQLPPKAVRLVVCDVEAWSFYEFCCPACGDPCRKPADRDVVAILRKAYVIVEPWRVSPEVVERLDGDRADDPPLTYDDVLDFALALQDVDRLVYVVRREER